MRLHFLIAKRFVNSNKGTGRLSSVVSTLGITIGCFALIISVAVLNGFESEVNDKIKNFEGDIKLSGERLIDDIKELNIVDGIKMVSPNRERRGLIKNGNIQKVITFKEVNIDMLQYFYEFPLIGEYPSKKQILIGYDIASSLGLKVGDEVIISSPLDQNIILGYAPSKKLQVSGIFYSKILDYDDKYVFISENIGNELFNNRSSVKFVDIKIDDPEDLIIIKNSLTRLLSNNVKVESWEDRHSTLVKAMNMEKIGSIIVLSLIILVASFNMMATLSLITIKKIKDIGVLRIIGSKITDMQKIIFAQALIIGGKGTILGLMIGVGVVSMQELSGFIKLPSEIYAMDVLPMVLSFIDILIVLLISLFLIIIPGWFSARKISKIKPIESLRWIK